MGSLKIRNGSKRPAPQPTAPPMMITAGSPALVCLSPLSKSPNRKVGQDFDCHNSSVTSAHLAVTPPRLSTFFRCKHNYVYVLITWTYFSKFLCIISTYGKGRPTLIRRQGEFKREKEDQFSLDCEIGASTDSVIRLVFDCVKYATAPGSCEVIWG